MPIITLSTDFGWRDPGLAFFKGKLVSTVPTAQIIDISHEIIPHNILDAAFIFKQAYKSFPPQSIHIIAVDLASSNNLQLLYFYHEHMHFIVPDNGILSLIFDSIPSTIIAVQNVKQALFKDFVNVIPEVVATIARHEAIEGVQVTSIRTYTTQRSIIYPDMIKGMVMYIDHFDNAITNISIDEFTSVRKDRDYEIFFGKNILKLSDSYAGVPEGEKLCLFNRYGLLEIAINKGNASGLLNLRGNSMVQINFLS